MKQFTYTIRDDDDLNRAIEEVKAHDCYAPSSAVFAEIMVGEYTTHHTMKIASELRKKIRNIHILGISTHFEIAKGQIQQDSIVLGIFVFEKSNVHIFAYDEDVVSCREMARGMTAAMREIPEAVCARLYINTSFMKDVKSFFQSLELPSDKFSLAGDVVSSKDHGDLDPEHYFFTDGEKIYHRGAALVVFSGNDLYAETIYSQGWRPTGISHTITKIDGNEILEIDGLPATELYQKYLGVEVDENFIENILEFPLMVQHGIYDLVRDVPVITERGGLLIKAGIFREDKVRLSMGTISEMLNYSWDRAKKLAKFRGEALFLTVCTNRNMYMKEEEKQEIEFFTQLQPELSGCCCFGELVNVEKGVFLLNCSLVAMAMREGEPATDEVTEIQYEVDNKSRVPFFDKVTHLIQATTEEYMELEEQEKERELQSKIEVARAANNAKSSFLSNMSHEIRTPINSILGMDEMILRKSRDAEITEYAQNIKKAGDTLLSLINEILDFSKIEAGKMEIIPIQYSLSSMLNDLYVITEGRIADKKLELVMEVDPEIPDECIGDEIRIRQILMNLLSNAVKYTKEGKITFCASYKKIEDNKIEITFRVKDTGIGIKEDDIPKLYAAFERIEEKRNRNIEGTGLGMNITVTLLELMGSRLQVSSVYGEGSEFSCALVQEVADWAPIGNDYITRGKERGYEERQDREFFHAPDGRILAVDDTSMNLTVIRNLLGRTKVQVDTVESGKACLEAIKEAKYDMIFMDHRMPEMDGTETMKAIRKLPEGALNRDTPIIVLTANAMSGMKEKFMRDGFDAYLPKPVNPNELENTVRHFLPEEKVEPVKESEDEKDGRAWFDKIEDSEMRELLMKLDRIPQLTIEDSIENCGDPATYLKVLKEFVYTLPEKTAELKYFIDRGDIDNFTIKVHALKTAARLAGFPDFSRLCFDMEKSGDARKIDFIYLHITLLLEWADMIANTLREMLPDNDNESYPEISKEELYEGYEALKEFIEVNDFENVEMIFDNLRKYRPPESEKEKYERVRKAMDKMEYERVGEILND